MKWQHLILLILGLVLTTLIISGGTFAYWTWTTSTSQRTAVNFTAEKGFTCSGTGGEPLTSESISLLPTSCTDSKHVLKREINITAEPTDLPLHMSLTLDVAEIGAGLSASKKFRFALTTGSTSCTDGLVRAGHFNGKVAGDKVTILDNIKVEDTTDFTYYLWIWLDKSETSPTTAGQTFTLNLSGTCTNVPQSDAYAVYSATDKSLRFYRSETPITVGSTYNGRVATAVYTGIETDTYISNGEVDTVPWSSYRQDITTVVVEDEIAPVSTAYWFGAMKAIESVDVSKLDTSNVTDMSYMFCNAGENATTFSIEGLSNWDTSSVISMFGIFTYAGFNATTWSIGDLSNWDTSSVIDMGYMFRYAGHATETWSVGDLSNWDTSQVENMSNMFYVAGYNMTTTWSIGDISKWDVSNVIDMSWMFASAGLNATIFSIGDLSNWDTSNVTSMAGMFNAVGINAKDMVSLGNLSNWDVSNVTNMSNMFSFFAQNAPMWDIGDLSDWDTSNVTNMSFMFQHTAQYATTWDIGDLSRWDTSKVTDMQYMFYRTGEYNVPTWSVGDLSNWNTSNVTNMNRMFAMAGSYSTTFEVGDLSNWNTSKVTNMDKMFSLAGMTATNWSLNLSNWDVSNVTVYSEFNYGNTDKITPPAWV